MQHMLLLGASVLPCACTVAPGERVHSARAGFANDDSELYLALSSHDEHPGPWDDTVRSDYAFEVRVSTLDGASQRTVLERRHRSVRSVFFQASEDYLLVVSNEGASSPDQRAEVVRLDGEVELLEEGNVGFPSFLPDPTGALIARLRESSELAQYWPVRSTIHVSFLDAATLERVGELAAVEFPMRADAIRTFTWSTDGRLIVSDGVEAFAVALDGEKEAVPVPSCAGVVTAGGPAADGRVPQVTWDGDEAEVRVVPGDGPGWPTRCFPEAE